MVREQLAKSFPGLPFSASGGQRKVRECSVFVTFMSFQGCSLRQLITTAFLLGLKRTQNINNLRVWSGVCFQSPN